MFNEVTVLGVVGSVSATPKHQEVVLITGLGLNTRAANQKSIRVNGVVPHGIKLRVGSLVYAIGVVYTTTVKVERGQLHESIFEIESLSTISEGPFRVVRNVAQSADGKIETALFNRIKMVGVVANELKSQVDEESRWTMYFTTLATHLERKINGQYEKRSVFNFIIGWNMHWMKDKVKLFDLLEVTGHLQPMVAPTDTTGLETLAKLDVVAYAINERTDFHKYEKMRLGKALGISA